MRFQVTVNEDEYPELYEYLVERSKQGACCAALANDGLRWRNGIYRGNTVSFSEVGETNNGNGRTVIEEGEDDEILEDLSDIGL